SACAWCPTTNRRSASTARWGSPPGSPDPSEGRAQDPVEDRRVAIQHLVVGGGDSLRQFPQLVDPVEVTRVLPLLRQLEQSVRRRGPDRGGAPGRLLGETPSLRHPPVGSD